VTEVPAVEGGQRRVVVVARWAERSQVPPIEASPAGPDRDDVINYRGDSTAAPAPRMQDQIPLLQGVPLCVVATFGLRSTSMALAVVRSALDLIAAWPQAGPPRLVHNRNTGLTSLIRRSTMELGFAGGPFTTLNLMIRR
jgi:hypothetical protein